MTKNKSAQKRLRVAERNRIRNKGYKTTFKNRIKSLESFIKDGKKDEALSLLTLVQKSLDKASSKGAIHKNKAARLKSQVMTKINKI